MSYIPTIQGVPLRMTGFKTKYLLNYHTYKIEASTNQNYWFLYFFPQNMFNICSLHPPNEGDEVPAKLTKLVCNPG